MTRARIDGKRVRCGGCLAGYGTTFGTTFIKFDELTEIPGRDVKTGLARYGLPPRARSGRHLDVIRRPVTIDPATGHLPATRAQWPTWASAPVVTYCPNCGRRQLVVR